MLHYFFRISKYVGQQLLFIYLFILFIYLFINISNNQCNIILDTQSKINVIPTALMLFVMDYIITNANDSYLVSLGEGCCRCRRRRRFPSRD